MNAWPSTLPQSPLREFDSTQTSGLAKEDELNNPYRIRTYPEYSANFQFQQATLAQKQALWYFYDVTLNQGAPFSAPWLTDSGYEFHFLRFAGPPSSVANDGLWDLAITVEIIAMVPMSDSNVSYWVFP